MPLACLYHCGNRKDRQRRKHPRPQDRRRPGFPDTGRRRAPRPPEGSIEDDGVHNRDGGEVEGSPPVTRREEACRHGSEAAGEREPPRP